MTGLTRKAARPMLAAMFVSGGYTTLTRPEAVVPKAEKIVAPLAARVPWVPEDTATAVRLNGAVQVAAGLLLATGAAPRLGAAALAGSLVPTTLAGHRFWEVEDAADRAQQRIHFLKNLAMFGGLLIAATERGRGCRKRRSGRPGSARAAG